jgi:hypothetical protein
MKLSEVKEKLDSLEKLRFKFVNGEFIPEHFHVTEVGRVQKDFIDCGGTVRSERAITFQLWKADDYDHRLAPQKLKSIIELSEKTLELEDLEVEVEYQSGTIGRFGLCFDDESFVLTEKQTDCLAKDKCGITVLQDDCCSGSGCC